MTILIVRVVPQGMIFGADRNITEKRQKLRSGSTKIVIYGQNQRRKVLKWPNKKALVGYAGEATIGGIPADEWLYYFIGGNMEFDSFEKLAEKLKIEVQEARKVDEGSGPAVELLIHLGGFEKRQQNMVPVVYYIRNTSKLIKGHYIDIKKEFFSSDEFQNTYNFPAEDVRKLLQQYADQNSPLGFQHGLDLLTFNSFDLFLRGAFDLISQVHPDQPTPQSLCDWEKYVKMSILTYGAFFETYNIPGEQYVGGGADIESLDWPE